VVLKIIKHCKENLPELVTGQLLGLDVESTLEVTDCFPFPTRIRDENEDQADENVGGAEYQIEMMRCLREVNVDNNTVGWYSSTYMGAFLNELTIETQYNYQERIQKSVVVIYDPLKTSQGALSLKAYRLTQAFMQLYRSQTFTKESLNRANVSSHDIFEEVPIRIHNSLLSSAFLYELQETGAAEADFEKLDLSTNPFLEKSLEFLVECLDDLSAEQGKFQFFQRNLQRQSIQQNQWLQKRRAENAARKLSGEPLLPEEEDGSVNPIFKAIPEPSRLESLLITNQIHNYCKQVNNFSGNSFTKLFLAGNLQKE
jgi:translation initiation factor 3 subunit H